MNKVICLSVSVAFMLAGITSCKQAPATRIINGIVYDASMNNLTVISNQGDTINISTTDANPQKVPGVLLNDSVEVTCINEKIGEAQVLKATELTITAHSPYYYIQGTWLEPNPINPEEMQGFTLNQNGTAKSVNMATLLIKGWNLDNKMLTLQYESIGNKQTISGIDTLTIAKINTDSLILMQKEEVVWRLARQK